MSNDTFGATPFLTAGSDKALPKYSAKPKEDINKFIYKLRIFLQHPSIDNCHLDSHTTSINKDKSKNLAALLSLCLGGNALSPFINNSKFDDKGIEMLCHLMDMKHPISQSSASTLYNALTNQTIGPEESFNAFAKRLRLMYKTCTCSDIPYDEGFLIQCFVHDLDKNFDYSQELLDQGVLPLYNQTLNEVLILVNDIKLNKQSTGTWITTPARANATGKQGAKRPSSSTPSDPKTDNKITKDPSVPDYLYKPSELSQKEIKKLLERYSCSLCRKNTHPLHTRYLLKNVYKISMRQQSNNDNMSSAPSPPANANRVNINLPFTVTDEPERYDGYNCVIQPPTDSASDSSVIKDDTDTSNITDSLCISKINNSANPYLKSFSKLKFCMGSVRQCSAIVPTNVACYHVTGKSITNDYPIIINSGATHHMWNDATAFISYTPMNNCYVSMANNYKLPIKGSETIQLNINGYYLQIHNVNYVPTLHYSLYSAKQHRRYIGCSCSFDNNGSTLIFPKFQF